MRIFLAAITSLAILGSATSAQAAGCLSGAVVGGVAGHYAGHHAILGAIAGCALGHHQAVEAKRQKALLEQQQKAATKPGI